MTVRRFVQLNQANVVISDLTITEPNGTGPASVPPNMVEIKNDVNAEQGRLNGHVYNPSTGTFTPPAA